MSVLQSNMPGDFILSDPSDRVRSLAATLAVHLALGAILLTGLALKVERDRDEALKTFNVAPPPPPPPSVERSSKAPADQPAPAGKKANPSPIVAPPARIPAPQPIIAAPLPGTGAASTAGAAVAGTGTGAGGNGAGRGGGGAGIGTGARLLSGNRARLPRQMLSAFAADRGFAHLLLTISDTGRVTGCTPFQGTGNGAVDDALCRIMIDQSRWAPALDTNGKPISVQLRYTSIWSK